MKKITYLIMLLLINKAMVAQINLAIGGGGAITGVAQSYNENRGAEVLVVSPTDITIQSLTLGGFYCGSNGGTDSAYLGARIYNSATAALLASANDSVYNIHATNVTIPVSYTLLTGNSYRISVYAWGPHPPTGNSGLMYDPATLPYTEPSGMLQIIHGYDVSYDTMPYNNNIYVPLISLNILATGVNEIKKSTTFSVYPDPFSQQTTLKFDNAANEPFTLSIFNMQGQLVETKANIISDNVSIERKNLRSGLYFSNSTAIEKVSLPENLMLINSWSRLKMEIKLKPIATVKNSRTTATDDFWEKVISEIELADNIPTEAFENISGFSHLEIIYYFDKVESKDVVFSGRPRGNPDYPLVGIFGQRKKDRPNTIGLCTVELIEHNGRTIKVKYLDAIDGTPVLDIKPVFKEFQPQSKIRQPSWVNDLMKDYWR